MSRRTVSDILVERGNKYNLNGTYYDHAKLTQDIKNRLREHPGWSKLSADKMESLDMIVHKIARILNGDSNYKDNWDDLQGYAKLVSDKLE